MKWESLENKIKTALYGHKPEVDVDALWSAIEQDVDAINRKNKRLGFIWFWLAGILTVGIATGYFYKYSADLKALDSTQHNPIKVRDNETLLPDETINNGNENSHDNNLKSKLPSTDLTQSHLSENAVLKGFNNHNKLANEYSKNPSNDDKKNYLDNQISASQSERYTQKGVNVNEKISSGQSINFDEKPISNEQVELKQLATILPTLPLSFFENEMPKPNIKEMNFAPNPALPFMRKKDVSFALNLQGSISFIQRKLELRDSVGMDLLQLRDKTERELEAYQFGLSFTLQHRTGFNLSAGFNYTQINEQFRYIETVTTTDTMYGVQYLVINLNDDTTAIYGYISNKTKTTTHKEYYNKYRMFDIPVLAGYRHQGHDFTFGAQAGVFVNLSLSTHGQILKSASETTAIDTAVIFKPNIGLSYYFGLYAGYKINDDLEVHASPFVRHFPKDFTNDSYAIRQRYNLYGLNIGLRYGF